MSEVRTHDNLQNRADIWPVFICYRQSDGRRAAERIFNLLNDVVVPHGSGTADSSPIPSRLDVYLDRAAPAVGDWTAVHEPYLKRARAFILVCTPGAKLVEGTGDWVHKEIDWWIQNREQAPILIDALGTGERYVPDSVLKKWPNAQRIEVVLDEWHALTAQHQEEAEKRIVARILGGLTQSAGAVYREELKREQERAAELTKALHAQTQSATWLKRALSAAVFFAGATVLFIAFGVYYWQLQQRTLGATYGATAQFLLLRPVTNETAPIIAATAAEGWRLARTSESWNALQRVPVVRQSKVIEQDDNFESYGMLAVSSQANRIVVLDSSGVRIWHSSKGRPDGHLPLQSSGNIKLMAMSPAHDVVATASTDGTVRLWSTNDGHEISEPLLHDDIVLALGFSEDGKQLVASTQAGHLYVWNVGKGAPPQVLQGQLGFVHIALSAAGKLLAASTDAGSIMIFSLETNKKISAISAGPGLVGIAFGAEGRQLVVANNKGIARAFSISGKELTGMRPNSNDEVPDEVALSRDGKYVATVVRLAKFRYSPFEVRIASVMGTHDISLFYDDGSGFDHFAFAADSRALLIGHSVTSGGGAFGYGDLWEFNLSDREERGVSLGEQVRCLALDSNGTLVAIATGDDVIRIISTAAWKEIARFPVGGELQHLALSSDGSFLAAAGPDKKIRVWSVRDSKLLFIEEHKAELLDLMFSDNGHRLESISADGVVKSVGWLPDNKTKEVQIGRCREAKFSSNGSWLVCEGNDEDDDPKADVIQMETGKSWSVSQWPFNDAPSAIAISNDGRMVAAGQGQGRRGTILFRVRLENSNGNGKHEDDSSRLRDGMATIIAFSHRGDLLITAEDDGTVRLTDVKDDRLLEKARIQQSGTVASLAIDLKGRIFTGSTSGSVQSWNPDLDAMLDRLCRSPGVNVTKDEWKRSGYLNNRAWRPVCKNWP